MLTLREKPKKKETNNLYTMITTFMMPFLWVMAGFIFFIMKSSGKIISEQSRLLTNSDNVSDKIVAYNYVYKR